MAQQLDLMAGTPIARATDPVSSHEAAERITAIGTRNVQNRMTLRAFVRWPGLTTRELAARLNVDRHIIGRRAPELRPVYLVNGPRRRCTITGESASTWFPTPVAHRWIDREKEKGR